MNALLASASASVGPVLAQRRKGCDTYELLNSLAFKRYSKYSLLNASKLQYRY